jgi:EAP30/Vps36 family
MHSALQRQAWVKTSATEVVAKLAAAARGGDSSSVFNESAGIAGILRRQEAARAATTQIASEAFSDLNSLMDKAKDVVSCCSKLNLLHMVLAIVMIDANR